MPTLTADIARQRWDYDPETGVLRWKIDVRGGVKAGTVAGKRVMNIGYLNVGWDGKQYYIHRVIWLMVHGEWPPDQIDHINGDRTDNRIVNLRCVSKRQNNRNMACHRGGHLPGTKYEKSGTRIKRWCAGITINGKKKFLGAFHTQQQAHKAYLAALNNISTDQGA